MDKQATWVAGWLRLYHEFVRRESYDDARHIAIRLYGLADFLPTGMSEVEELVEQYLTGRADWTSKHASDLLAEAKKLPTPT